MRILNIGDIQKYKIECRRCNSIIEFNEYEEKYANIARGYFEQYDYYYINKNNPKKVYLLTTEEYYFLDEVVSETEFSLITEGYNQATESYGVLNRINCKITDKGVELSYDK